METDIVQRLTTLERLIQKISDRLDQQNSNNRKNNSFHSALEDEVNDVHCIFRFLRQACCWTI
jgi:hypothetical protein